MDCALVTRREDGTVVARHHIVHQLHDEMTNLKGHYQIYLRYLRNPSPLFSETRTFDEIFKLFLIK